MMVLPGKEEELHGRRSVWGSLGGLVAGGLHRHSDAGGLGLLRGVVVSGPELRYQSSEMHIQCSPTHSL